MKSTPFSFKNMHNCRLYCWDEISYHEVSGNFWSGRTLIKSRRILTLPSRVTVKLFLIALEFQNWYVAYCCSTEVNSIAICFEILNKYDSYSRRVKIFPAKNGSLC